MSTTVYKEVSFEAAHRLPHVPKGHKCERLHGHSYRVLIEVSGELNEIGWVVDYADIVAVWRPIHELLDHHYINEVPGLENSTSEILARWIFWRLRPSLPGLSCITVRETCTAGSVYRGD